MADYLPALRFKALTPAFDALVRTTLRERTFKPALIEQAGLRPGHRVLDLGAGTGTLAIMAKAAEPAAEVTGLDADPQILRLAGEKAADAGADIGFDEGLATKLPYAEESFDRVLSTLFFHHLLPEERRACLAEVRRVLDRGGEVHVADYTTAADPVQAALAWQVRLFDGRERTGEMFAGEFERLLGEAGFTDVRVRRRYRSAFGTLALYSAAR